MTHDPNIIRHSKVQEPTLAPTSSEDMEAISNRFEEVYGPCQNVLHELVSTHVHIDVYPIPPADNRPFWVLHTTGMSDRPMSGPPELGPLHAEVMIKLPADWPVDTMDLKLPPHELERIYWPIRWLKQVARLPHQFASWVGVGHTIPNGDPAEPFADNTKLCSILLLPPTEQELAEIVLPGKTVQVLQLVPLYVEEQDLKLKKGASALLDRMMKSTMTDIVDLNRPNVALRKRFLGLF